MLTVTSTQATLAHALQHAMSINNAARVHSLLQTHRFHRRVLNAAFVNGVDAGSIDALVTMVVAGAVPWHKACRMLLEVQDEVLFLLVCRHAWKTSHVSDMAFHDAMTVAFYLVQCGYVAALAAWTEHYGCCLRLWPAKVRGRTIVEAARCSSPVTDHASAAVEASDNNQNVDMLRFVLSQLPASDLASWGAAEPHRSSSIKVTEVVTAPASAAATTTTTATATTSSSSPMASQTVIQERRQRRLAHVMECAIVDGVGPARFQLLAETWARSLPCSAVLARHHQHLLAVATAVLKACFAYDAHHPTAPYLAILLQQPRIARILSHAVAQNPALFLWPCLSRRRDSGSAAVWPLSPELRRTALLEYGDVLWRRVPQTTLLALIEKATQHNRGPGVAATGPCTKQHETLEQHFLGVLLAAEIVHVSTVLNYETQG